MSLSHLIVARQRDICVSPQLFSFYMRSVSYERKLDDYLFPELLVFNKLMWQLDFNGIVYGGDSSDTSHGPPFAQYCA
jgi:hypothetical protein